MWDIYFNVFGPLALGWFIFVGGTMYLADQKDQAGVDFKNSLENCLHWLVTRCSGLIAFVGQFFFL